MKLVINNRYGGYNIGPQGRIYLGYRPDGEQIVLERNDPRLVACVEALGPEASGRGANLIVVEIPDDVAFQIENFGGWEWIAEQHRTWTGPDCQVREANPTIERTLNPK